MNSIINFCEFYIKISETLNINSSLQLTRIITEEFVIDINVLLSSKEEDIKLEGKKKFLAMSLNEVWFWLQDPTDGELDCAADFDFVYNRH